MECLAYAARHPEFASLPATFWRGNRELTARIIQDGYVRAGKQPPIEPKHLASAMTALDIGLAIQNLVDPGTAYCVAVVDFPPIRWKIDRGGGHRPAAHPEFPVKEIPAYC